MLATILEILESMKICIPLALLTGLIFGYLYTKFKVRESYFPEIKKTIKSISSHKKNLKYSSREHQTLKSEIEEYQYKLREINRSIFDYKDNLVSKKESLIELSKSAKMLNVKYEEKQKILGHYTGEIAKVKKECRLDDVVSIEENAENMKRLIAEKKRLLEEKKDNFLMIQQKIKTLEADNRQLESRTKELDVERQEMASRVMKKEALLKGLEKDFVTEIEGISHQISLSKERATEYKEKLLRLKSL